MASGVEAQIKDTSWEHYQHEFGSAGGSELGIDLNSDLMRLAAGGSLGPTKG
jgi:FMN reductase